MHISASTLTHDKVRNSAGEDLGRIEDFVINASTGEVSYAVLSFGGFLGMGDKLFAVPMQAMRVDTENHTLILDTDKEKLKEAPGFDKDHWPQTNDDEMRNRARSYYGL